MQYQDHPLQQDSKITKRREIQPHGYNPKMNITGYYRIKKKIGLSLNNKK